MWIFFKNPFENVSTLLVITSFKIIQTKNNLQCRLHKKSFLEFTEVYDTVFASTSRRWLIFVFWISLSAVFIPSLFTSPCTIGQCDDDKLRKFYVTDGRVMKRNNCRTVKKVRHCAIAYMQLHKVLLPHGIFTSRAQRKIIWKFVMQKWLNFIKARIEVTRFVRNKRLLRIKFHI